MVLSSRLMRPRFVRNSMYWKIWLTRNALHYACWLNKVSKSQWISWPLARAAFLRQAVEHGGRSNYDMVRFQAALAWPQTVFSFMGRVTVFDLAAAYADGVVRMRPFG